MAAVVSDRRKLFVWLAYSIWVNQKEGCNREVLVNWRSSEVAVLAVIRLLKAVCLLPICIMSVPSKTAASLQDFAALCKCSHSLQFTALLQCLRLSWASYSLVPTPCRQVCSTARVRALEGGPPLSFWLEMLPVGWLLPLWLNNTGLLPLASLPFLFTLHANSRISCPWLFYPDGKIICISYAQRNNKPFLHK